MTQMYERHKKLPASRQSPIYKAKNTNKARLRAIIA